MILTLPVRIIAAVLVFLFGLKTFFVVRGNIDAFELTLWGMSPQLLALIVLWRAKTKRTAIAAALLIVAFWIAGVTIFFHGGPVGLFLPIQEVIFLVVVLALVRIGAVVARLR